MRLENDGIIVEYAGAGTRMHVPVKSRPGWALRWRATSPVACADLLGDPAVAILRVTNGRWDLLVGLRAESLQELAKVLERIRLLKGISNTETSIHLKTFQLS